MTELQHVLERVRAGARIRFLIDFYGQTSIEVGQNWLMGPKRIKLPQADLEAVRQALRERRKQRDIAA